jgi:multiple sugar transport system ATP-binding protein
VASVEIVALSKRFDSDSMAVDNVSMEIEDGEFLVLLGPSGCGKTTLLRMIAGLEEPTSGEILIGDRPVAGVPAKDRDIAMVFQNYALYPHMRIEKNITLGLKIRKTAPPVISERLGQASQFLRISEYLRRFPRQLSGGQQQRSAVARAVVREPAVLLMDEPLSNLDARLRVQTRTELIQLHRRTNATIIYVTHDQSEAMTMGTRVAVMLNGKVQQCGGPLEVYRHPVNLFVASFLGSPEMNVLPAQVMDQNGKKGIVSGGFHLSITAAQSELVETNGGREFLLGIRSEHLRLADGPGGSATVQAQVEFVEPLGSSTLVYSRVGDQRVVGQISPDVELESGQMIVWDVSFAGTHLFDKISGAALW